MKRICILTFLLILLSLNAIDTTDDEQSKNKMKFRGSVITGVTFYLGHHENIAENHYSGYKSDLIDYSDKGDPDFKHHEKGDPGRIWGNGILGTNAIDGKIFANFTMIAPFLAYDNFLLKDNNIAMTFKFAVSPVSLNIGTEISLTPIPFLVFSSGFMISSGFNIPIGTGFARNNFSGIVSGEDKALLKKDSFYGPVLSNWFNAKFQFDTSALMPSSIKRWTHIVMRVKGEMFHRMVPNLDSNIPYVWENDNGENYNGWFFYLDSIIGYKIPIIEDPAYEKLMKKTFIGVAKHNNFSVIAGFMANIDEYNVSRNKYSPMADGGWGSDFMTVYFGPMAYFELPNNFFSILAFNWQNGRVYTDETVGNADFTKREYKDWYVFFNKISFAFGWSI